MENEIRDKFAEKIWDRFEGNQGHQYTFAYMEGFDEGVKEAFDFMTMEKDEFHKILMEIAEEMVKNPSK